MAMARWRGPTTKFLVVSTSCVYEEEPGSSPLGRLVPLVTHHLSSREGQGLLCWGRRALAGHLPSTSQHMHLADDLVVQREI